MKKIIRGMAFLFVAITVLCACTANADEYQNAVDEITLAYLNGFQKPKHSAISCGHKEIDQRQFIRCQLIGIGRDANLGVYEVVGNDKPIFYAINGKAMSSIEALSFEPNFKKHPSPAEIDIPALLEDFEGATKPVIIQSVVAAKALMSDQELSLWCNYTKEADALSRKADRLKLKEGSEKRKKWIDKKFTALQKQHFTDKGMTHAA